MENFVEIQNFGFNSLTITSSITMLFTIFQGYGVISQNKNIWQKKSGESLSATLFFLYGFFFIAFFFYGLSKNSLAMTFNGFLAIPYIPLIIGLIKFKRLTFIEKLSLPIIAAIVPIMILLSEANKDYFLFFLLMTNLVILMTQPLAMLKSKTQGAVDIKFILIFSSTSIFWLIYALALGNWVLIIFNSVALLVYALIIYLYRRYQDGK